MAYSVASNGHDAAAMLDVRDITTYYGSTSIRVRS